MSLTTDVRLSSVEQDKQFIVNIKTAIVRALRATLDDRDYPDRKIQGIKVSMEFPMEENLYPHIWVEFSFDSYQSAGHGHTILEDGTVKQSFIFQGDIRFNIMALTSYERDIYASQLLQLLAFSSLHPATLKFDEMVNADQKIRLAFQKDIIRPEGQTTNIGTHWSDTDVVYSDTYSIKVIGEMFSVFTTVPEVLREIDISGLTKVGDTVSEIHIVNNGGWT